MKKYLIVLMLLIIVSNLNAQEWRPKIGSKAIEKIEQMETAKLIQVLDLDEETSVRFFAKRKEHREKLQSLMLKRKDILDDVEDLIRKDESTDENVFKQKLNELIDLERKITNERLDFYTSLQKILRPKQIIKLISFDEKFRREIRETLLKRMNR